MILYLLWVRLVYHCGSIFSLSGVDISHYGFISSLNKVDVSSWFHILFKSCLCIFFE